MHFVSLLAFSALALDFQQLSHIENVGTELFRTSGTGLQPIRSAVAQCKLHDNASVAGGVDSMPPFAEQPKAHESHP